MARTLRTDRWGLTLVDTVVGVGILFLLLIVLLNLAGTSVFGTRAADERLAAERLATSILEEFRAQPFPQQSLSSSLVLEPVETEGLVFQPIVAVEEVPPHPVDRLRRVTVIITWESRRGTQEATLACYVNPLLQ